jgi:hypothetical protein
MIAADPDMVQLARSEIAAVIGSARERLALIADTEAASTISNGLSQLEETAGALLFQFRFGIGPAEGFQ